LEQWHQQKLRESLTGTVPTYSKITTFQQEIHRPEIGSVKILKTSHASSLSDVFIVADPDYYPNIREIFHIPLTMPIESVPCERPFSALRRLKQRNRTTMVEDRLHGLALLHIYREVNVDSVNILDKFDTGNRRIGALYL
jgi:hypothetical protein